MQSHGFQNEKGDFELELCSNLPLHFKSSQVKSSQIYLATTLYLQQ